MTDSNMPIPLYENTIVVQDNKPLAFIRGAVSLPPGSLIEIGDPKRDYLVRRMRLNAGKDATLLIDVEPIAVRSASP
jgi:hypothetical protein